MKFFLKMSILHKGIYTFNAIPTKIPAAFFYRSRKNNPQIHMEPQNTLIAKAIPRKKNKAEGTTIPDFKLYYKARVIKTVWYWHKKKTCTNGTELRAQK